MNYHRWIAPAGSSTTGRGASLAPEVERYLHSHPGITYDQIAEGLRVPRSTVAGHMREASNAGTLRLEVCDKTAPYHFRLAHDYV